MKTKPFLFSAIAGLAAISTVLIAQAAVATDARVEVIFSHPEKFTDVRDAYSATEMGRKANLDQIRDYVVSEANNFITDGRKLTVTFTDIDLAGDFEPWRGPEWMDIRGVKDIFPPRMDLEFKLMGPDGTMIKEGKRELRDLAFMSKLSVNQNDALRFDKALLDDWFRSEFRKGK